MTAHHTELKQPGKYDCPTDEYVHGLTMDGTADSFGDVTDYGRWFAPVDLDPTRVDTAESDAIEHYESPWLLVIEHSNGFVTVLPFATEAERTQRTDMEREDWLAFSDPDDDPYDEHGNPRQYVAGDWRRA